MGYLDYLFNPTLIIQVDMCRLIVTAGIRGNPFRFCCAQKKIYTVCFKHTIKTKIMTPKNVFSQP